jgi:hypothetical protein
MMHSNIAAISAIERWDEVIGYSVFARWTELIKYMHDGVLNNKTKEKLYKIYMRALPVSGKFTSSESSKDCSLCGFIEDEMHCIVACDHA